jgi:hypothetical protein
MNLYKRDMRCLIFRALAISESPELSLFTAELQKTAFLDFLCRLCGSAEYPNGMYSIIHEKAT